MHITIKTYLIVTGILTKYFQLKVEQIDEKFIQNKKKYLKLSQVVLIGLMQ